MRVDIISAVPDLLHSPLQHSILKQAQQKGLLEVYIHNLRDYATNKHKQIDDTLYGGGAGMVLMIEPIDNCISTLTQQRKYDEIIYLCPDGELFTQKIANQMSMKNNLILLCGHYKGIDERVREHLITREISIGDFVLSGGELPALVIIDAIARLIPGVLSDETSALTDSFQDDLIAPPIYTRPAKYKGWTVPEVLLSGNFAQIEEWRYEQSILRTQKRRPHLILKFKK
ncbi:MAG: tRNA (guanosine(37)-N1)-methyltransferase TrmD [Bacteroidia bacterium]|nr:tRNA (guanosine(37)-N1)-methyltransferase TrmD [Bacteroidia bacterium]MDW8348499.1 tRNA (guanosine(37)-N1)-methyltransferase TrmD [Bacteroidia bacterium]